MVDNMNENSSPMNGDYEEHINSDNNQNVADEVANKSIETDNKQSAEKVKPKRITRNPQPKFNDDLLRGHRGLSALSRVFKRVNMKGRGHEKDDLSTILRTYSYWCHRMFPKYPFSECVEKLEKLGSKKRTMAYMQRIRMDLIEDEAEVELPISNIDEEEDDRNDTNNANIIISQDNSDYYPVAAQTVQIEMTHEIMEKIRANRERALQLRTSKMREKEEESIGQNVTCDDHTE